MGIEASVVIKARGAHSGCRSFMRKLKAKVVRCKDDEKMVKISMAKVDGEEEVVFAVENDRNFWVERAMAGGEEKLDSKTSVCKEVLGEPWVEQINDDNIDQILLSRLARSEEVVVTYCVASENGSTMLGIRPDGYCSFKLSGSIPFCDRHEKWDDDIRDMLGIEVLRRKDLCAKAKIEADMDGCHSKKITCDAAPNADRASEFDDTPF